MIFIPSGNRFCLSRQAAQQSVRCQPTLIQGFISLLVLLTIFPPSLLYAANKEEQSQELNPLYVAGMDWYSEDPYDPEQKDLLDQKYISLLATPVEKPFDLVKYYDDLEPPNQDGILGRYSILAEDAAYFLIPAFTIMGAIYLLPEDISNWEKDDVTFSHGLDNWPENVSSWEWDNDDLWINYIGHPYCGSSYYIYARHYGYSRLESFWFSFAISSFYEIGIEAWAEPVSIQDMIFTPLLGSLLGELLLPLEHRIKTNDNKVLGSRIVGNVSLALIDPFGHVVPPLKRWTKRLLSKDADLQLTPTFSLAHQEGHSDNTMEKDYRYGLQLTIRW